MLFSPLRFASCLALSGVSLPHVPRIHEERVAVPGVGIVLHLLPFLQGDLGEPLAPGAEGAFAA
jgi:hypothetical protein